jgi:hypothetical protein
VDELAKNDDITTNLSSDRAVSRHQIVEIDDDWQITPATDAGSLMTSLLGMVSKNPSLLRNKGPVPTREPTSLLTSPPELGRVVLEANLNDSANTRVLVLLDSRSMVGESNVDDLEGDRTVFAQVDSIVPEDSSYSLDKFFLTGFPRTIRRAFSLGAMVDAMSGFGYGTTDIQISGPLFVLKAVAIY